MRMRELTIHIYLFVYRLIFTCCKVFPLRNKVVLIDTIGQQCTFIIDEMMQARPGLPLVLLKRGGRNGQYRNSAGEWVDGPTVIPFESKNPIYFFRCVYHIATSRFILIDNYHAFLSVIRFKPGVECIQLWHAVGGFKRTGLKDHNTDDRSDSAKRRFTEVYRQFSKLPVGSDALAKIHVDAFGLPEDRMLPIGVPRTDLFFDTGKQQKVMARLRAENPALRDKKVLLYAPTYREGEIEQFRLHLDLDAMQREFGKDHILLLRLHPAIRQHEDFEGMYPGFVYDYSSYPGINELLLVTDCLITDYSSVICDYALLRRPMVFYLYDLDDYLNERGLWEGYESMMPGPVVYTMPELVRVLKTGDIDLDKVAAFADIWHTYSTGQSSRNLVAYMLDKMERRSPANLASPLSDLGMD
jgi:teichoic acid glycerol-phosphate primase